MALLSYEKDGLKDSPHPMHYHRSPVQQVPNSHGLKRFLLEGRLYRHIRSPSPPPIRTHTASQGVRPLTKSGSRPCVPVVQGGAANARTLAVEMPKCHIPLVVLRSHSESSRLAPRRCWRSLGPPSIALDVRLNSSNNNTGSWSQPLRGGPYNLPSKGRMRPTRQAPPQRLGP